MELEKRKTQKKSPLLKEKPLRIAGQSLDEEMNRIVENFQFNWAVITGLVVILALWEWVRWFNMFPPTPVFMTIIAAGAILLAGWKYSRLFVRIRPLKLGRDGERQVGEQLEKLRQKGFHVFHDIVGENFNVDHVLIGPSGVLSIETKTISKPINRDARVTYSDKQLKVDGYVLERDPIAQSCAGASWIKHILAESTGKEFRVRPVVLFPGWFVERMPWELLAKVWVLTPKAFPKFLENEQSLLSAEDVSLASYHLSRHIRGSS